MVFQSPSARSPTLPSPACCCDSRQQVTRSEKWEFYSRFSLLAPFTSLSCGDLAGAPICLKRVLLILPKKPTRFRLPVCQQPMAGMLARSASEHVGYTTQHAIVDSRRTYAAQTPQRGILREISCDRNRCSY